MALARTLTERVESSEDSLEGLFAGVRKAEVEVESALHPDDFAPEEPELETEPIPFALPERRDGDLSTLVGLPLFAAAAQQKPSSNGDRPDEHRQVEEPVAQERVAVAVAARRDASDQTPAEGQQLRLL